MSDRNRLFGRIGRKGKQTIEPSDDKPPTSKYESVPMSDVTKIEQETNNTLCGKPSSEIKKQPTNEDIKKWVQENIKLRTDQAPSKKHRKRRSAKREDEERRRYREDNYSFDKGPYQVPATKWQKRPGVKIVRPKVVNSGKSREEEEERRYADHNYSFDKGPYQVSTKGFVKQSGFKSSRPIILSSGKSREDEEGRRYREDNYSFDKGPYQVPAENGEKLPEVEIVRPRILSSGKSREEEERTNAEDNYLSDKLSLEGVPSDNEGIYGISCEAMGKQSGEDGEERKYAEDNAPSDNLSLEGVPSDNEGIYGISYEAMGKQSGEDGEERKYAEEDYSSDNLPYQVPAKKWEKLPGFKSVRPKVVNSGKSREGEVQGISNIPAKDLTNRQAEDDDDMKDVKRIMREHISKVVEKDAYRDSDKYWTSSSSASDLPPLTKSSSSRPLPPPPPTSWPQPSSSLLQSSSSLPQLPSSVPQPSSSQLQLPQSPSLLPSLKLPSKPFMLASSAGSESETEELFSSDEISFTDEEEAASPSRSTDAFGEVKFVGYGRKIAKFVRADHKTSMEIIIYLITEIWSLSLPKLLISVTGGRKDFLLNSHLKEAFGYGLVKAASSTGAWIMSAGLHRGVVKYTGKAIYDNESILTGNNKLVTISIAPWNCVRNKDTLKREDGSWPAEYKITDDDSCERTCSLDPNHSHFILVDNGTSDTFGVEANFRKMLEDAILQKMIEESGIKIPAVVVMIEGGPRALKSVCDSISRGIPVVIVKGSGRAADVMADAYQTVLGNIDDNAKCIPDGPLQWKLEDDIREIIWKEFQNYEQLELLVKCVLDSLKRPNLVTLFESDSAEKFDMVVLKALFKAKNNKLEKLRLALEWNRTDIAKNELFTEEILWPTGTLDDFMLFALREDRVEFVKLFMEHGVSLKELLTEKNIEDLYKMENKDISFENASSLLNHLIKKGYFKEKKADSFHMAIKLFLWALFLNRKEMAFLFWKEGMGALPSALIANDLLKLLKLKCKDYDRRIQIQEHADIYEKHAVGVLTECYYADEKGTLDLLRLQRETWNDASCMQIAFSVNNKKFVSQAACQSLLTKIWRGKISKKNNMWKLLLCTFCPLFIFFLYSKDNDKQEYDEETNKPCSCCCKPCGKCCNMFCRCVTFYNTPVIKFLSNLIFYIIFLVIYSYVLLVQFKHEIFYLEWLLIVWVIGIFTEEIHQIFKREIMIKSSNSICPKFRNYIQDIWNVIDVITIILFIIGYILRFLKVEDYAKVILSLNLISFYIRFLHMLSFFKHLGPKLIMIKKMMQDLGYFIIILFVLMIAYGIASQSISYPSEPASYDLFKKVLRKAYFHMYAELFLEEYEEYPNCTVSSSVCPSEIGRYVAPVLMSIYVLLTNILLLNLLIAMFSSTFQKVEEKSHLHWSFQRYEIIFEFCIRPPLPPPFILLSNIYQFCCYLCTKAKCLKPKREYVFLRSYETDLEKKKEKRLILWEDQMVQSYITKQNKSDSNNKNLNDQLQMSKYENSQNISFSEPEKEFTKSAYILNQRLQNIEEKINNIDTTLAILKENLMGRKY